MGIAGNEEIHHYGLMKLPLRMGGLINPFSPGEQTLGTSQDFIVSIRLHAGPVFSYQNIPRLSLLLNAAVSQRVTADRSIYAALITPFPNHNLTHNLTQTPPCRN